MSYTRITKHAARKRFNEGLPVNFCPRKLRPGPPFGPDIMVQKSEDNADFDRALRYFNWYNSSWEAGYYAAFYVIA